MKYTQYFLYVRQRPDRAFIKDKWILETIDSPVRREVQSDGRIKKWGYVEEVGKYLLVVLLEDDETIHNAFFDRGFKEGIR